MLKGDINSGVTGDKNPVFDPGLSPLGTDDEAAGHPPGPLRIALARYNETIQRWMGFRKSDAAHQTSDGVPFGYLAFVIAVGLVLIIGIVLT